MQKIKITERVKTFEDACKVAVMDLVTSNTDTLDEIAYKKIKIIVAALNEGWEPDWRDSNEWKYYPYFGLNKNDAPGVGFRFFDRAYGLGASSVGSRLVFKTKELALYAGKQFESTYKEYFVIPPQKITDRVKSFEDACRVLKRDPDLDISVGNSDFEGELANIKAYLKLTTVVKALNEGWQPDWSNKNEAKYYPWMTFTPGVGFRFFVSDGDLDYSSVGSRLVLKSRELAEYAGKQFEPLINQYFTL